MQQTGRMPNTTPPTRYDLPWKAALTYAFRSFIDFYFPDFSARIDWRQRPRFRDKELAKFAFGAYVRGQVSTSSDTPLWFPQSVVTFGMLLLTLQFLARAIQAVLGLPLEDHRMKASPVE